MSRYPLRAKLKASGLHLGVSTLIFLPILYLLVFRWFPGPLFVTDGGWQGLRIMILVDLVLGPALMFLIYSPAKPVRERATDIAFIAVVQLAALIYGYNMVENMRPMLVTFHGDRFYAVTKDRLGTQEIAAQDWERLGDGPPYWTAVRAPATADEASGAFAFAMAEELAEWELLFLQEPLQARLDQVKETALRYHHLEGSAWLEDALAGLKLAEDQALADLYFVRLEGYFRPALVALDGAGRYVGSLYLPPKEG